MFFFRTIFIYIFFIKKLKGPVKKMLKSKQEMEKH